MQAIETKRLKVSHPDDLNDIYDCRPKIIYDKSFSSEKNKGFEEGFSEDLARDMGINCYCGNAEDLLLWSHYGDSHKGVALGFEIEQGYFEMPDRPSDRRIIVKVDYPEPNTRKVIDSKEEIAGFPEEVHLLKVLEIGYSVKGVDWKYEDEYREFLFLDESIPSGTLYFSKFRPGSLREVILGERCPLKPKFVLDLISYSKRNSVGYETRVLRARTSEDSFAVEIRDAFKE
jgi:hypothetical protein